MRGLLALGIVAFLSAVAHAQETGGRSSLAIVYFPQMPSDIKPQARSSIVGTVNATLSRGVDPKRIDFLSGIWECINDGLVQQSNNSDADVVAATRKCSGSTDRSGNRLPKIDFVAILDLKADVYEENGVRRPLFVFRSNLYFVETNALVTKLTQASIAGSAFPDKCSESCFLDVVARDIVPFAEAHGGKLAEDIIAWLTPSATKR